MAEANTSKTPKPPGEPDLSQQKQDDDESSLSKVESEYIEQ